MTHAAPVRRIPRAAIAHTTVYIVQEDTDEGPSTLLITRGGSECLAAWISQAAAERAARRRGIARYTIEAHPLRELLAVARQTGLTPHLMYDPTEKSNERPV